MSRITVLALSALFLMAPRTAEAVPPAAPVAVIYSLIGDAFRTDRGQQRRAANLFDYLPPRAVLEVGSGSRLTLAFETGRRWELGGGARVTLGTSDFKTRTGDVRALPAVPPLPRLAPIRDAGLRGEAMLIRGERIADLYPRRNATSLANATVLRFQPLGGTEKYRVEIQDRKGAVSFTIETTEPLVKLPAGTLRPGTAYHWTVCTIDRPGPVGHGEADFTTLDAESARRREALLSTAKDPETMTLLAGLDRQLGLLAEARDELAAALKATPENAALSAALAAVDRDVAPLFAATEDASCPFSAPGLVVETVTPESAGFRVGVMPGDRLLSWCRTSGTAEGCVARGDLRTAFDWLDIQREEVARGGVVVEGARGSETHRWSLLPTFQGLTVAPLLQGALAEAYQSSRGHEQAGDPASAAKELESAAELADRNHCADAALWLRAEAAQLRAKARQWSEADAGFQAALAKARELGAARVEVHLQMSWSEAFVRRGDATQARQRLESALSLEEKNHPESLTVSALFSRLGIVATNMRDDLDEADRLFRRAYDLVVRAAPGSGSEAGVATNLATNSFAGGDLAQAELYATRALAIREKHTPSGDAIIPSLGNFADVLFARGDFAGAEAAFLRSRRILEKVQPESVSMAKTLHDLGMIAHMRGDDDAAEDLFRRELALFEKLDPSGSQILDSLIGLGEVAVQRHQGDRAEESWQRALAISEKMNPKGPKSAWCLLGLAAAVRQQGRGVEAEKHLQRALAISQEINPESIDTASIRQNLGVLLFEQGDAEAAEAHLRTAIRINEKNRLVQPEGYQALARLQARRGQAEEAAESYREAVKALEDQRTRLGGAQESQWLYGSSLGDLYFEAAAHQIALHRPQEAWRFVERGRARGFQELLAQRDLRFPKEIPAPLYAERHRLAAEYDQTQAALANWLPDQSSGKLEELKGRLRDLRLEQAELQEKIRRSSPRLGALESFTPLDLPAARSALDPGTVLLTYSIGESRSFLFVIEAKGVSGPGLSFYSLPVGREGLQKEIEAFRRLLDRPGTDLPALKKRGRHLYDLLVRPAARVLAKADRWLISPDGPLHSLPFAALVSGDRYLAESKPIHIVASAAVYEEIKATRSKEPSASPMDLLVGDPFYPQGLEKQSETATDPQVQTALRQGLRLESLPASRIEVKAISDLFPKAQVLLGRDATEEAIKELAPQARRLHFACHGLLDERFPLNSALALSIPDRHEEGRDNGLLQAWEIFESVRLHADLVTLSACDSGLGKEMGGEGLVGLVRAFQFAGARSVVASLWSVEDVSTANLMKRFYGYLRAGKTKDEALRQAQVDSIHGKKATSHPYHWAAFQLSGDWR